MQGLSWYICSKVMLDIYCIVEVQMTHMIYKLLTNWSLFLYLEIYNYIHAVLSIYVYKVII